jgi:hypothetical protein
VQSAKLVVEAAHKISEKKKKCPKKKKKQQRIKFLRKRNAKKTYRCNKRRNKKVV